ncbi:hypothetical protein [Dethiosulfovibrio salsuginis]|uniref:Uncharacterized protein n=1 Tax=Dethiosulfovibrio salsuginis TaxID=561720 RepID=A0A1X7IV62_9BACT|nr:hypothetical protein [Dethiosulfovibrio salsuginis]SMG18426.1 hypothetical protein SAMN06275492_10529 [Dethiosulfovibrio salsuginis]
MEKIVLDGVDLALDEVDKGEVYQKVSSILAGQSRVVSSILIDGVEMDPQAFVATEGGSVVEFVSMEIGDLVVQSLLSAEKYIPKLRKGVVDVADLLEQEKIDEAMALSVQAMEGLDWVLSAVSRCASLLGCSGKEKAFAGFEKARGELEAIMESIVGSFEAGKTFKPALVLREEVPPLLDKVSDAVSYLRSQAGGRKH